MRELSLLLERAEASGISDRSLPEVFEVARQEARQRGLLRSDR
ncbi:hypothetical protein [Aquibaculum sediminis]